MLTTETLPEDFEYNGDEIAVVGLSLRVPGANDPWTFWQNLQEGRESFDQLTDEELEKNGVDNSISSLARYVKIRAALNKIGDFDPRFFGLSPFDASLMDPQYRHFLEMVWETLESAGEDPFNFDGNIGVYAGSGQNTYLMHHLMTNPKLIDNPGPWYLRHVGNDKDFMSTLASYHFDLKGPSINVQTACSTSLVAVHLAAQALISRECDMAVAGGVTIDFPQGKGYLAPENGIEDPTGHCKSFDAQSQGTVFSSGGGAVLLKRYEDAIASGNQIYAVIKASAVSNDGAQKAGFTAPSVDGQASAITEALELGEINPETIGYVEGHGTATPIGDPIEVQALTTAWRSQTQKKQFAAISSVKSNVGHMDTGAGVVSLIKAIGAVSQGIKYPTVHFEKPNPALDIENTPFYVSAQAEKWQSSHPRRAAISSLGVGGTNAHIIIEEVRVKAAAQKEQQLYVPFSAKTPTALKAYLDKLKAFLARDDQQHIRFDSLVKTLESRRAFDYRAVISAANLQELRDRLARADDIAFGLHAAVDSVPQKIAFAFTGQGTQYFNMGRDLYEKNGAYKKAFDECAELLLELFGQDIRNIVFNNSPTDEEQAYLDRIDVTHPILFSIAYSLAQAWIAKGIKPDVMIGHSLGEYVAATIAGVFQLPDVLKLVCERGRLMQSTPEGVMLSVAADEADLIPILEKPEFAQTLSIAGVNVRGMSVVAGDPLSGAAFIKACEDQGISVKALRIPRASHSVLMDGILDEYEAAVATCERKPARIPIGSNLNGQWLKPEQSTEPRYWRQHLRSAVRFADGADTLMQDKAGYLFIEIGPGAQLSRLLEAHPSRGTKHAVITSLPGPKDTLGSDIWFESGLARAWAVGAKANVGNKGLEQVQKMHLPTYAWDHQTLLIEPVAQQLKTESNRIEKLPFQQWFTTPGWKSESLALQSASVEKPLIIVMADYLSPALYDCISQLRSKADIIPVFRADTNEAFELKSGVAYRINGLEEKSYQWLLEQLDQTYPKLHDQLRAVVEWVDPQSISVHEPFYLRQRQYFHQSFYCMKALSTHVWTNLTVAAVGYGLLSVSSTDIDNPMKVMVQGPLRSFAAEQAGVRSLFVDFDASALKAKQFYSRLLNELIQQETKHWGEVAYRGSERLVRHYQQQEMPIINSKDSLPVASLMRKNGVYFIAGFGDLALVVADYIVNQWQGTPVFIGRSALPAPSLWAGIAASARIDAQAQRIRHLVALQSKAPQLRVFQGDVSNPKLVLSALESVHSNLGAVHGIFHTAGILNDQLLSLKKIQQAEQVLAPKVAGVEAYERWFATEQAENLDFMLMFSSISSFTGQPGQTDYASANGFLGTWARKMNQQYGLPVNALHWGIWADVGMAAQAGVAQGIHQQVHEFKINKLIACHHVRGPQGAQYQCYGLFDSKHWVLDNHRTDQDMALCPGTGYIDLFANSFKHLTGATAVELTNLSFQSPLAVRDGDHVLVGVIVDTQDGEYQLKITTGASVQEMQQQVFLDVHTTTQAKAIEVKQANGVNIDRFKQTALTHEVYESNTHDHIHFGPMWQVLNEAWFSQRQALLKLSLAASDSAETLIDYPWHPGLLDLAIGAQSLMNFDPATTFYVPMYYESIKLYKPLEADIYSFVQVKSEVNAPDVGVFDVQIMNAAGDILVEVTGFHLKKSSHSIFSIEPVQAVAIHELNLLEAQPVPTADESDMFAKTLSKGIKTKEGQMAIDRVLQLDPLPSQVNISSIPLGAYTAKQEIKEADTGQRLARPHMSVSYEEPQNDVEILIADIWAEALGIDKVGRQDQFFELGGHSLLLIQIIAKLKRKIAVSVPMSKLFDASTIAQWADIIGQDALVALTAETSTMEDSTSDTDVEKDIQKTSSQSFVSRINRSQYLNRSTNAE
ncbi:MAG TPA: hypothetical protein DHW71_03620 [Gammaproteobacteria bacterium]|nr:hypothetical protein [Gammaproteobacteria bacterium]